VSDPTGWGSTVVSRRPPPALDELQNAVIEGVQVRLGYVDRQRNPTERVTALYPAPFTAFPAGL